MDSLAPTPILEFNPNQMAIVRKTFGYGDLNRLHQDINIFEDWIKMQHHFMVKEYDKDYLERYLINSKGSIERAKKRLDKLCTLRALMPEYLQKFDIENEFKKLFKISQQCLLPKPTPDNHRVIYYGIHNSDAACFDQIDVTRYLVVMTEYLYCHDYNTGIEIVADTRKITLGIVSKLNPMVVANTIMLITEAFGLRLRGFHLITGSMFLDIIVTIIKQGLSKKLIPRFHVHEDLASLFNFIPKDLLPEEIGGDLGPVEELRQNNFKEFVSPEFIKKMKYLEGATTNESKRLRCKFNEEYSGMPGSFKVLRVD